MARRTPPATPERPRLSLEQKRQVIARLTQRIAELEAFDPSKVTKRFNIPEVTALETAIDETLSAAFGHGTVEYRRYDRATVLDHGPVSLSANPFGHAHDPDNSYDGQKYLAEGKAEALGLLRRAVRSLEEEIADEEQLAPARTARLKPAAASRKIFVVHGHDEAAHQAVARFLEQLGLEAIILREQPDQGRTIIEKFEHCASEVGFAVVLLTPDDLLLSSTGDQQVARARQNVIFELGYFVGRLGRGRACLLRKGEVEIPSDLYGVIYSEMDSADGWKLKLVRELKAAELDFDANRMW